MSNNESAQAGARPGAAGALAQLSPGQSSALLRSAAGVTRELLNTSLPNLLSLARDGLSERWDFDPGAPPVLRLLDTKSPALCAAFSYDLAAQQDAVLARLLVPRNNPVAIADLDATMLELVVDEADDAGKALANRTARRIVGNLEDALRELELIIGYLADREQLATADNPFTPQVFVMALLRAAVEADLQADAWGFFLNATETHFSAELGRVYQALMDHFRRFGVDPRAVRRARAPRKAPVPRPSGGGLGVSGVAAVGLAPGLLALDAAAGQGGAVATDGAGAASGGGRGNAQLVLQELLSRLQTNVAGGVLPPLGGVQGSVAPPLLDALSDLQRLGMEGIHGAVFAGTPAGSINAWREHLISQSTRTVDKLTIEIVGMLFDHVLRDSQVPSEIKALLSRLQFPMLKAALLDAAFFASSAHPARRLIDRIAAAAIGWEPYGDENERFRAEVERLVREILEKFDHDLELFERVLNEFEAFLGDIAPRENDPIARAKRALEEAEKREVLTINTTIQVRRAFELVDLESFLREFLIGPWVQVLVQASLRDDQTKGYSKSFREVIHEIVWSVQPKATGEERRRLVEMIPNLTRIIRDGLTLIRMPPREQEEFLQQLMAAHAVAVKPTDQATYIRSALQSSEVRAKMDNLQMTGSFPLTAIPGGVKVLPRAVLRAAADHQVELTVPAALTDVGAVDKTQEARMDHDLAQWARGSWFELWNGEAFIKARLRWISPLRTMFMFSSGTGNRAHVMSPELIRSYLRRDYLRPLESAPLTERAAQAVVADFASSPERAEELTSRLVVE